MEKTVPNMILDYDYPYIEKNNRFQKWVVEKASVICSEKPLAWLYVADSPREKHIWFLKEA